MSFKREKKSSMISFILSCSFRSFIESQSNHIQLGQTGKLDQSHRAVAIQNIMAHPAS